MFKNARSYQKKSENTQMNFKPALIYTLSNKNTNHLTEIPRTPINTPKIPRIYSNFAKRFEDPNPQPVKSNILWGEPFWNFFHILAEKVIGDSFPIIRSELLSIIFMICSNLPCPDCTQHAIQYLNGVNFNNIQTKESLKETLYNFHNTVNVRKRQSLFPRIELETKYKQGLLYPSYLKFIHFFKMKHHNVRLMSEDLHRQKIAIIINNWFTKNYIYFNK